MQEVVMYVCVWSLDFASFYDFDIWFWNCYDGVVFLVFHFICLTELSFLLYLLYLNGSL